MSRYRTARYRHMAGANRTARFLSVTVAVLLTAPASRADDAEELWEFTLRPHVWLPSANVDAGGGGSSDIEIPPSDVLAELNAGLVLNLDVRRDRWGLMIHGLYSDLSAEGSSPGPFFNLVDTSIKMGTLEMALFYRVLTGERGWLDIFAGARYVDWKIQSEMQPDYAAVDTISADVVNQAASTIRGQVSSRVSSASEQIAARAASLPSGEAAAAGAMVRTDVQTRATVTANDVVARVERHVPEPPESGTLYGEALQQVRENLRAELSGRVERGSRKLGNAIQSAMAEVTQIRTASALAALGPAATTQEKAVAIQSAIQSTARASLNDIKRSASDASRRAVEKAEQELASTIDGALNSAAAADHSHSSEWIAPFVGMRGRWEFSERWYLGGRADIGGFGAGNELAWQVFGGVGFDMNETVALEAGWRHLVIDYDDAGISFDATFSGAQLGMGLTF